jgi:hypothetical protein
MVSIPIGLALHGGHLSGSGNSPSKQYKLYESVAQRFPRPRTKYTGNIFCIVETAEDHPILRLSFVEILPSHSPRRPCTDTTKSLEIGEEFSLGVGYRLGR